MSQQWRPITDYECDPADLGDKELRALSGVWIEQRHTLGESVGVSRFTERLKREWAIETGLIERLYTLDRGITELMIEHGVKAALIPHAASNNPERTAAMIGDHESAIDSVFAFVKGERPLSTSYVKELHSLFTQNQQFAEGQDQFGRKTQVPLIRGDYKELPNNPTRPDGTVHQYCPPEHVAAEMDRVIDLHVNHGGSSPEVEAAWLHHRFAQIHPFQDGNGRIARALATLIFIKADWLPLVVRNSERSKYIDALETADNGDLKPLVSFFAALQKRQFIKAIGIARDLEQAARVDARIRAIRRRLRQRRDSLEQEWRAALSNAAQVHTVAKTRLNNVCAALRETLNEHREFSFFVDDEEDGGRRSHYFKRQIVSTAKRLEYYANTGHYRSWVRLVTKDGSQCNILIAFHCIGHEFQGVLACSGTWFQRVPTEDGSYETEGKQPFATRYFRLTTKKTQKISKSALRIGLRE